MQAQLNLITNKGKIKVNNESQQVNNKVHCRKSTKGKTGQRLDPGRKWGSEDGVRIFSASLMKQCRLDVL